MSLKRANVRGLCVGGAWRQRRQVEVETPSSAVCSVVVSFSRTDNFQKAVSAAKSVLAEDIFSKFGVGFRNNPPLV